MLGPDYYVCDCGRGFYRSEAHGHKCEARERAREALARMLTPVKTLDLHEQYAENWEAVFGKGRDDG